ncbi:hypothetical protein [Bradyrhizobium cenepequi]
MNSLVRFWRRCDFRNPPYIHPDDRDIVLANPKLFDTTVVTFDSFLTSDRFGRFDDNRFHMSLLPSPYGGDLDRADIYILMLNPGFSPADYYHTAESRSRKIRMLRQSMNREKFPFVSLDPELCWRPGFVWWEKKLREVIGRIADAKKLSYVEAMQDLSQRLAVVELVPYHSSSFRAAKVITQLASVNAARTYVRKSLLPRARSGDAVIIVTRKIKAWGIKGRNVVLYENGETRGASMGIRSRGGKAILKRYGI